MAQIYAHINFNGECRDAMNSYKDCPGGNLIDHPIAGSINN
jgi:hypothetical protein